jgi:hypothetical protein
MDAPRLQNSPKRVLRDTLLIVLGIAGWLVGTRYAGTWTPSREDAIRGACGLALGLLWMLPEYLWHRLTGDDYIRLQLRRQTIRQRLETLFVGPKWYHASLLVIWGATMVVMGLFPTGSHFSAAALAGLMIGVSSWYWHSRAVWKRMWELYEQEKTVALGPIAAGDTPVPRVEG